MTPAQIRERMETASGRLTDLQSELERKEGLLRSGRDVNGDGTFDEQDSAAVAAVRDRRDTAQNRMDGLLDQLIRAEAEADGTPIEEIDFEDPTVVDGDGHRKLFTDDRNDFKTQISGWRTDVRESLGRMVNTMLDPNDPGPGFPKNEIVSLAQAALTASQPQLAAALGIANTMLDLATNFYQRSLPSTPSLREIETKWRDAIDQIDDSAAGDAYDALVDEFRRHHHMDPGERYIYSTYMDEWDALLDGFRGGRVLPSSDSINRAFMAHIISQMPDSPWDMNWTSGEVQIYMEFDMDRNDFSFSSGSIDDLTNEVRGGLSADPDMFGSDRVTSLPTPIRFKISGSNWSDGSFCELYRRSNSSGDTTFELIGSPLADTTLEEQGTLFQIFMNRRIYDRVSVRQVLS